MHSTDSLQCCRSKHNLTTKESWTMQKIFKPKLLYSTVSWEQNLSFVPPLLCCTFVGPSGQHHPAISIIFSKAGGPRPCHAGGLSMALGTEQCAVCGRSAVGTCPPVQQGRLLQSQLPEAGTGWRIMPPFVMPRSWR